jgi:hypothetical protein
MKKFKEYLSEEVVPQALSDKGFIGIEDESVRDNINSLLNGVTTRPVVTPYISLERVRKVLSYYHIYLPAHQFMQGDCGNKVFNISQFGEKFGMTNDGEVITKSDSPYSLYFEYQMNDSGLYDIYAEVVDDDELEEIMSDFEDELSDDNGEEDDSEVVSSDQQNSYLLNKDEHKGNVQEAKRVVTATKKAKKGTKWKLIARNPDSEGSNMELRQGKRRKMAGGYYRDTQEFGLLPTKKGKMDMKAKSQYFDMPADIMKTVKEETINEISRKLAKKAEHKAAKKYYKAYDDETDAREKVQKEKTPEARKGAEDAKVVRLKAKDRVIKFQQYNDKKNINEVSQKAATDAYAAANDPSYYHPKADDILKHIRRKFGKKAEKDAENHAYADHFGRGTPRPGKDSLSGGLRQYASDKVTKSGKIPKGTQTAMKNKMDPEKWPSYGRKIGGPKGLLPEEQVGEEVEQLDEVSQKAACGCDAKAACGCDAVEPKDKPGKLKLLTDKKVNEALSDHRSSRKTGAEEARSEIHKALMRKKQKEEEMKIKMKEQAAPVETPITFPASNSREGFRV